MNLKLYGKLFLNEQLGFKESKTEVPYSEVN